MRKYYKFLPEECVKDADDNSASFENDLYFNTNSYNKDLILSSIKLKHWKNMYYSKSNCSSVSKTSMSSVSSLTPPNTPSFKYTKNMSTNSTNNSSSNVAKLLAASLLNNTPLPSKKTYYIQQPRKFDTRSSLSLPSLKSSVFEEINALPINLSDENLDWVTTRL